MTDAAAPADVPTSAAPRVAWWDAWWWPSTLAMLFVAAPLLLQTGASIIALPAPIGPPLPKAIEAGCFGLLVLWAWRKRWLPEIELSMALGLFFMLQAVASGLWAPDQLGFTAHLQRFVHHASAAIVVYLAIRTRRDLDVILVGWKLLSLIVAALSIVEYWFPGWRLEGLLSGEGRMFFHMERWAGVRGEHYRAQGPLGHANFTGYFLAASMLLQPYLWTRFPSREVRVILVVITILEAIALFLGYVRLATFGVLLGMVWMMLRGNRRSRRGILILAVGGLAMIPFLPDAWITRTFDPRHIRYSKSVAFRWNQVRENVRLIEQHGLFGVGYGGYGAIYHDKASAEAVHLVITTAGWRNHEYNKWKLGAHNTYLEVAIEQGLLGVALILATGLVLIGGFLRQANRPGASLSTIALSRGMETIVLITGVMSIAVHAQDHRLPWLIVGVGAAFIRLCRAREIEDPPFSLSEAARWRWRRVGIGAAIVFGMLFFVMAFVVRS